MSQGKRVPVAAARLKLLNDQGTEGVLLGTLCRECEAYFFGSVVMCRRCSSSELEPVELSSQGTLYSYTIVRIPPAGWPGGVPYALGQVELPEGPHVISEVLDCPYEKLEVGMKLELALAVGGEDAKGDELVVYKWRQPS